MKIIEVLLSLLALIIERNMQYSYAYACECEDEEDSLPEKRCEEVIQYVGNLTTVFDEEYSKFYYGIIGNSDATDQEKDTMGYCIGNCEKFNEELSREAVEKLNYFVEEQRLKSNDVLKSIQNLLYQYEGDTVLQLKDGSLYLLQKDDSEGSGDVPDFTVQSVKNRLNNFLSTMAAAVEEIDAIVPPRAKKMSLVDSNKFSSMCGTDLRHISDLDELINEKMQDIKTRIRNNKNREIYEVIRGTKNCEELIYLGPYLQVDCIKSLLQHINDSCADNMCVGYGDCDNLLKAFNGFDKSTVEQSYLYSEDQQYKFVRWVEDMYEEKDFDSYQYVVTKNLKNMYEDTYCLGTIVDSEDFAYNLERKIYEAYHGRERWVFNFRNIREGFIEKVNEIKEEVQNICGFEGDEIQIEGNDNSMTDDYLEERDDVM